MEKTLHNTARRIDPLSENSLPGLNIANALRRLGGNVELYLLVLREYASECLEFLNKYRQVDLNDEAKMQRCLHNFKGVSANVGADDLAGMLALGEKLIATNSFNREDLYNKVQTAIEIILNSIDIIEKFER